MENHKKILETEYGIPRKYLDSRSLETAVNPGDSLSGNLLTEKEGENTIITRFPPEPNGHLHIGHAKAINFNFGIAGIHSNRKSNSLLSNNLNSYDPNISKTNIKVENKNKWNRKGICFLRFDDTNPNNEAEEYIKSIKSSLTWLGFEPTAITHASDYFQELYDCAIQLIRQNDAFICFLSPSEAKELREKKEISPYREKFSIEENLDLFEKMANGEFEEGKCVLRIKLDPKSPNPTLRDPPIYRIIKKLHPRSFTSDKEKSSHTNRIPKIENIKGINELVKSKLSKPFSYTKKVFPLYDFTHCICDSLEGITISCCTLEFEIRRDIYYAILDKLNLYKPFVFEYARLNLEGMVTSKRKIKAMIDKGAVGGWDDPRLATLIGLERRGVPACAINRFSKEIGVTRNDGTEIKKEVFEKVLREELDVISKRAFCVKLESVIKLFLLLDDSEMFDSFVRKKEKDNKKVMEFEVPTFPNIKGNEEKHKIKVANYVYINGEDFKEKGNKKYFGLTSDKNKRVRLKYCFNISFAGIFDNEVEKIKGKEILVKAEFGTERVKKGSITFVSDLEEDNLVELRFFVENNNNNGVKRMVKKRAIVSEFVFEEVAKGERWFQFERMGFFYLDNESELIFELGNGNGNGDKRIDKEKSKFIFNEVVGMKVSKEKQKILEDLKISD